MSIFSLNLKEAEGLLEAQKALKQGNHLVVSTDTVPGLTISLNDSTSHTRLLKIKGYEESRPFTWHFPDISKLQEMLHVLPPGLPKLIESALKDKCTVIVPKRWLKVPENIRWPFQNIGLRVPQNDEWKKLFKDIDTPVLATSANQQGEKPLFGEELKKWAINKRILYSEEALHLQGSASTVLDLSKSKPLSLRGEWPKELKLPGKKIVIVCTGNTCRSPLAAEILKKQVKKTWGLATLKIKDWGWEIVSAGIAAQEGIEANKNSQIIAQEMGLDLSSFRSQSIFSLQQEGFDEILGMTRSHYHQEFKNFHLIDPENKEIDDPFGSNIESYRRTSISLETAIQRRIRLWQKER